jgi:nitrogen-specific signal transduction histidine kinase/ActR/RegA family two-component response regulator
MSVALQAIDVTASLAMEEQLREAQKMEAIGRLAGGVAHDFNNSLTAIGGFASLIATDSQEPETRESARTILGAAQHAAILTRELLAYSRKSFLQPQVVDLSDLVTAVRPMLQPLVGENVSVVLESRGSTAMVRVDPGGFERVILNLAANARDAMPAGGTLTLAIDRKSTDETAEAPAQRWVALCVSDTGVGIPAELQSQVFDPFFTTKPVGSGTGLGLAMVKGFVLQSGGTVTLQSEPGSGTTIEILLPEVQAVTISGTVPAAIQAAVGGEETILVVEDEPAVAAVSFQVLSRSGYHILLADSGESAIALLRAHTGPIALLLLDVILPDVRGPVLAEVAKTIHPESAALFASGYSTEAMGRRGDLAGEVDLIQKPFSPDELLARVRRAIDRTAGAAAPTS